MGNFWVSVKSFKGFGEVSGSSLLGVSTGSSVRYQGERDILFAISFCLLGLWSLIDQQTSEVVINMTKLLTNFCMRLTYEII